MENELYLTDLIDAAVLQRFQDAFSRMTGIASLTTDADGVAVTQGSKFSEFCMKYTRTSNVGCMRCEKCDKFGAEMASEQGKSTTYFCHAGLIDFAAPIIADGKQVGCFIGGQVLTEAPVEADVRRVAAEIGVDPDAYWEAAQKVNILEKETIDRAAEFLYTVANIFSDIAYNKYLYYQANQAIEKAANMKSDFLANMSHEIRTPMNAVIGMAEMALREDLPPAARDYINQIKASGKSLLAIINDILDFSKIESGKMDINVVPYEPMSLINDVSSIIMTRLQDKDVELILDITPTIPNQLLGDPVRINQVLINLANNATKFTHHGQVAIIMKYAILSEDEIQLQFSVEDTGIGIKEQDLSRLFQSFQQLDSKRNRNIEGTGLGLAISKQLMTLMQGDIHVESTYEKGSIFSFSLPQKIIDSSPAISVRTPDSILAVGFLLNPYLRNQLKKDTASLNVAYTELLTEEDLLNASFLTDASDRNLFLFVEHIQFTPTVKAFIQKHPQITAILIVDFFATLKNTIPNVLIVKKPLYALNLAMIFNREAIHYNFHTSENHGINFIAPEAEVLIVDDNDINLTVTEGLLEPLKMNISTASGGMEALEMITSHHYDLVFMDHMMPELDGVETTRIIRNSYPEYQNVPIIALTANAVDGTKEMFLKEGMNDFIPKPIELQLLISKVRQWLPQEKLLKVQGLSGTTTDVPPSNPISVGDLDTKTAIHLLGNESLFWAVLKDYYRVIEKKASLIKSMEEQENWERYTIEVHALKSASKQIGAMRLSEQAAALEQAGNAKDAATIHQYTDALLALYRHYQGVLEPFFPEEEVQNIPKQDISTETLHTFFNDMKAAMENLDIDGMETIIRDLKQYHFSEPQLNMLNQLETAVEAFDVDTCESILCMWETGTDETHSDENVF